MNAPKKIRPSCYARKDGLAKTRRQVEAWELPFTREFDPNQMRDERGRWSNSGGGPSISDGSEQPSGGGGASSIPYVKFENTTASEFIKARDASTRVSFLSPLSEADLKDSVLYVSPDKKVGYAISKDGDLGNLFNNGGPKGAGKAAIVDAIVKHNAQTLDCFDPFLPELYHDYGFVETGRMKWNDEYAPPNWDYARLGRPDVVFMAWKGGDRESIKERIGSFGEHKPGSTYFTDYDEAKQRSRAMAGEGDAGKGAGLGRSAQRSDRGTGGLHRQPVIDAGVEWVMSGKVRKLSEYEFPPGFERGSFHRFDDEQPRDEMGRWTTGGGGGSGAEVTSGEGKNLSGEGKVQPQEPSLTEGTASASATPSQAIQDDRVGAMETIATMQTTPVSVGKPYEPSVTADHNEDGVADHARVGVPASAVPPPPAIPRLPNLTEQERQIEDNFARAFEDDPDGMVARYNELRLAGKTGNPPNTFGTDDAKVLDDGWRGNGTKDLDQETRDYRSQYNLALHQTANAIVKKAFLEELDKVAQLPEDQRTCLVTNGGCGAGKGFALQNVDAVKGPASKAAIVWDSAGDQNSTENPWIQEELDKRGIRGIYAYVAADPVAQWADPKRGVVQRALSQGRMIDTQVYADSYILGQKNFEAFAEKHKGKADFFFLQNGNPPVLLDKPPKFKYSTDELRSKCEDILIQRYREGKINDSILYGGLAGSRIWG